MQLFDDEPCPRCGEPVSDYTPCACSFTPASPRASSSSSSMARMQARRGVAGAWDTMTATQWSALERLAHGDAHVHGATARALVALAYARVINPDRGSCDRARYAITPDGRDALASKKEPIRS